MLTLCGGQKLKVPIIALLHLIEAENAENAQQTANTKSKLNEEILYRVTYPHYNH